MKEHGKKIEYRCSNCGDTIPYGSESAIQGEYDDIFCSQECLWNWYGFEKLNWSTHREYERTKEELEEIRRKKIEQWKRWEQRRKQEEAEKEAYNEAHKNDCKEVEQAIMKLLDE